MHIHSSKLPIHSFEPAKDFGLSSIATSASWNFFIDGTSRMLSPRCPWIHEHIVWSVRYPQPHPCWWYFKWINIFNNILSVFFFFPILLKIYDFVIYILSSTKFLCLAKKKPKDLKKNQILYASICIHMKKQNRKIHNYKKIIVISLVLLGG